MSEEDNEHLEGEMPWGEMDEIAFRDNLRERLRALPDNLDYDERMCTFTRMFDIVREEMAILLPREIGYQTFAKDTRAQAVQSVEKVNRNLAKLGLALKHPESGAPAYLGIAAVKQPGNSWFQIESVDGVGRPYQVPGYSREPKDRYAVIPAPIDQIVHAQGRGRG